MDVITRHSNTPVLHHSINEAAPFAADTKRQILRLALRMTVHVFVIVRRIRRISRCLSTYQGLWSARRHFKAVAEQNQLSFGFERHAERQSHRFAKCGGIH
jgi:hypothetical protein